MEFDELADQGPTFDRVAADIDDLVAHLAVPALAGDALAGPELGTAEAAFEDLWQRCASDLTALADSVRLLSATMRSSVDLFQQTDNGVASDARAFGRVL